jgi:protein gp37
MASTSIEWATKTWNPVTGCTPISDGCQNCYAKRMAKRLAGRCGYPKDDPFRVTLHPERLKEPMHWRKPEKIFVCSMADLFHNDVPFDFIQKVFDVMVMAKQHTFLLLTKRPQKMNVFMKRLMAQRNDFVESLKDINIRRPARKWAEQPPRNVWLGVTAENQDQADERVPILLQIPAAKRFVSVEPMLGPVDLTNIKPDKYLNMNVLEGYGVSKKSHCQSIPNAYCNKIDWVICGGETGPNARPMHPDWARLLRDQCVAAGVPFFFKQMMIDGRMTKMPQLDGRVWNELPHS